MNHTAILVIAAAVVAFLIVDVWCACVLAAQCDRQAERMLAEMEQRKDIK